MSNNKDNWSREAIKHLANYVSRTKLDKLQKLDLSGNIMPFESYSAIRSASTHLQDVKMDYVATDDSFQIQPRTQIQFNETIVKKSSEDAEAINMKQLEQKYVQKLNKGQVYSFDISNADL